MSRSAVEVAREAVAVALRTWEEADDRKEFGMAALLQSEYQASEQAFAATPPASKADAILKLRSVLDRLSFDLERTEWTPDEDAARVYVAEAIEALSADRPEFIGWARRAMDCAARGRVWTDYLHLRSIVATMQGPRLAG